MNFNYQDGNIHYMDTPAQRIKAARKAKGVSQVQLANATGIDQSTISDIENSRGLSAEYLMRICDALELTPQFVMRGIETDMSVLAQIKELILKPSKVTNITNRTQGNPDNTHVYGNASIEATAKPISAQKQAVLDSLIPLTGPANESRSKPRKISKQGINR